jgi:copper transport protein
VLAWATSRLAASAVVLAVASAAAPGAAYGHASLLVSKPAPGERLEAAPAVVKLRFSERLNRSLSRAMVVDARSGREVAARSSAEGRELSLGLPDDLARGAYLVKWRTVSPLDGHTLEGSLSFGIRSPATDAGPVLASSPVSEGGWARVVARVVLYLSLALFAGGMLLRALLGADWLAPAGSAGRTIAARERRIVLVAGFSAGAAALASIGLETIRAADGLSVRGARAFLLGSTAGAARLGLVLLLAGGLVLAARGRARAAAVALTGALGTLAMAGHAGSAEPRVAAIVNDWVHVIAAAVWLGGVGLIVLVRGVRAAGAPLRADVLPRFGRVALRAFAAVAMTGATSALIQLGEPRALWETGYGRLLAAKAGAAVVIAAIAAVGIRSRRTGDPSARQRARPRRYDWRLLRAELLLGLGVIALAALLVAFPLPPSQLAAGATRAALQATACDQCPLRLPAGDEIAVAEQAGSQLVSGWVRHHGDDLLAELHVIDIRGRPWRAPVDVPGAKPISCGAGCWQAGPLPRRDRLDVGLRENGHRYVARLPVAWRKSASGRARRLLRRAQGAMRRLASFRVIESLSTGPGMRAVVTYDVQAPDRIAYAAGSGSRGVIIDRSEWIRSPGMPWRRGPYRGGLPFRARDWFNFLDTAEGVRLLTRRRGSRTVAFVDRALRLWYRVSIDPATSRIATVRMIGQRHYMTQRYRLGKRGATIRPPPAP